LTPALALGLQRTAGNQAVAQLLTHGSAEAPPAAQRQSHPRATDAVATSEPAQPGAEELVDPDRLAEALMRSIVASERALADLRLPPDARGRLLDALPGARRDLDELLHQLRHARTTERHSGDAPVALPPLAMGSAAMNGLAPAAEAGGLTAGQTVLWGLNTTLLLAVVLRAAGLYGGGPTVGPLDEARDRAREAQAALASAIPNAASMTRARIGAPPIAVPRARARRQTQCPPGSTMYDPVAVGMEVLHRLFYAVPARFAAASPTAVWRSADELRAASIRTNNTAIAVVVDTAGCERARGEGTFIQHGTEHAEIQALAQLAPVVAQPGWRLVVHVSAAPCRACAARIPVWAASRGLLPQVITTSKYALFGDEGYASICQTVLNTRRPPGSPARAVRSRAGRR